MSEDETFTEPEVSREEWVDVRMSDPEQGEWDVDVVVVGGHVEYVDLRIKPGLTQEFIDCLVSDVSEQRGREILTAVAERNGISLGGDQTEE